MKNIRHDRYGTQAYFKHDGHFYSQRWKAREHPDQKVREALAKDWLRVARPSAELDQPVPNQRTPRFQDDVEAYLEAVVSMPSYTDREFHMHEWATVFKGRERDSISPLEIRTQLERWRTRLSASSCNKRRTALMSFYTRMNGKSGYNPVRDVEKYPEDEEPRAQHPYTILRVLSFMRPSKTRARLMVILTTGWPHKQLKQLKPEHLDLRNARAYVTPRRKGKGRKGGWLPLLPAAVRALQQFQQWDCFTKKDEQGKDRPFSHSSMHSRFADALEKLNAHRAKLQLPPLNIRPYDLRHTFITALAHRITDERALQALALHSRIEQTRRYSEQATQGRIERAVLDFREPRLATLATTMQVSAGNGRDTTGKAEAKQPAKH